MPEEKKDTRIIVKFPFILAPFKAAILPLMKKDGMSEKATEIYTNLRKKGISISYDEAGSIGKRYRREDENGTPFCFTIDYETISENTVTVRNRDTMQQSRISGEEIENYLTRSLA